MKATSCRHVEKAIAGGGIGGGSPEARAAMEVHLAQCRRCRETNEISDTLSKLAVDLQPKSLLPLMERRLIQAALDGRMPGVPKGKGQTVRWVFAGAGVAATIAVLLTLALGRAPAPPSISPMSPPAGPKGADRFSSQNFSHPFEQDGSTLVLPESTLWGTRDTLLSVEEQTPSSARIRLKRGRIVVDVDSAKLEDRFVVLTPSARVEVRGTVFSVTVGEGGEETVRVMRGTVAVTDFSTGLLHLVAANQQFTVGAKTVSFAEREAISGDLDLAGRNSVPEERTLAAEEVEEDESSAAGSSELARTRGRTGAFRGDVPLSGQSGAKGEAPDSRELLRMAKEQRKEREFKAAKKTYLQLINRYPTTQTAANATVALAQMELGVLNDHRSALGHFEDYLEAHPNGLLSEEAWIGRMRSLMAIGDHRKAIRVSSEYLKAWPEGKMAAEMLRRRGDAYAQRGNCRAAREDYEAVTDRWPGSKSFQHARAGILACESNLPE